MVYKRSKDGDKPYFSCPNYVGKGTGCGAFEWVTNTPSGAQQQTKPVNRTFQQKYSPTPPAQGAAPFQPRFLVGNPNSNVSGAEMLSKIDEILQVSRKNAEMIEHMYTNWIESSADSTDKMSTN